MISAFVLSYLCHYNANEEKLYIYIKALVNWMIYAFLVAEGLSLFHGVTRINLIIAWLIYDIVLLVILILQLWRGEIAFSLKGIKKTFFTENFVLFILGIVSLLFAINTVPYNWDSMTYHLPRIVYWRQNGSVQHYASNIVRQVTSPVLAEFVNLHVYVMMNGNDRFLNVLQSASYITNAILVHGITEKLCAGEKKAAGLSAFLFMTMPIAFGESLTTQVDQFATIWVLGLVYLLLKYVKYDKKFAWDKKTVIDTFYMSIMIAFGYLAKPSVMAAILLLAIWLLVVSIRRKDDLFIVLKLLTVSVVTVGLFVMPEIARNVYTFHAISAPIAGAQQLIGRKNPLYVLVNLTKNFVWNLPTIYLKGSTMIPEAMVYKLAGMLSVDINDPGIAESGRVFTMITPRSFSHDSAVNPIVFYLWMLSWIWFMCKVVKKVRMGGGYLKRDTA